MLSIASLPATITGYRLVLLMQGSQLVRRSQAMHQEAKHELKDPGGENEESSRPTAGRYTEEDEAEEGADREGYPSRSPRALPLVGTANLLQPPSHPYIIVGAARRLDECILP